MAFRPPDPNRGKSGDSTYGYQIKAGCASGRFLNPTLWGESLIGAAELYFLPDMLSAKRNWLYGLLSATKRGQPK